MRSALFWGITRRRVVIAYRRFGATYRSHLHTARYTFVRAIVYRPVVPKLRSVDPKGSVTSSQGIRGYISAMATLKFTYFLK